MRCISCCDNVADTLANRREQLDAMADGVGKFAGMKEATIDLIKKVAVPFNRVAMLAAHGSELS
jgi:hypothetical protein